MDDDFIGGLHRGEMASDHFTIVANAAARDKRLSLKAKGLLLDMFSHRKGFIITEETIAERCTDGVKAVRAALLELREVGYIYRSEVRSRYPKGTKNKKGKDISGALGPYRWYVTDKPAEIAVILARYAQEQRAANLACEEPPGRDNVPKGEVVPTSDDAAGNEAGGDAGDQDGLPPQTAGSPDLGKQGVSAGRHLRPEPTGGFGSSKEDQPKKTTTEEEQRGGAGRPPTPPAGPQTLADVRNGVTTKLELGDPLTCSSGETSGLSPEPESAGDLEGWELGHLLDELAAQSEAANDTAGADTHRTAAWLDMLLTECDRREVPPGRVERAQFGDVSEDVDVVVWRERMAAYAAMEPAYNERGRRKDRQRAAG